MFQNQYLRLGSWGIETRLSVFRKTGEIDFTIVIMISQCPMCITIVQEVIHQYLQRLIYVLKKGTPHLVVPFSTRVAVPFATFHICFINI